MTSVVLKIFAVLGMVQAALATANCAVDWGWPDPEGITCYCIIPGQPGILHFEDLGDN